MTAQNLLTVRDLQTAFHTEEGAWLAVDGVNLHVKRGEILGLVGESGSGKSVTGFSLLGLIDPPGEVMGGQVLFKDQDLRQCTEEQLRQLRGDRIAMIFQDPLMTLNPVLKVGEQMMEAILTHYPKTPKAEARQRCCNALTQVGIPSAESRLNNYPHEFSGGMRQRVAIAIALLNQPDLIIADEPTTALDVTIQAQILYEVQKLCKEQNTALIWITHDLGVVAELADNVAVMYAGRIVEYGSVTEVLSHPLHPYTQGLLNSMPSFTQPGSRLQQIEGMAPTLTSREQGCTFRPRCAYAHPACAEAPPPETAIANRQYRCYYPLLQEATA